MAMKPQDQQLENKAVDAAAGGAPSAKSKAPAASGNLLTSTTKRIVDDVKELAEDFSELAHDAVDAVKEFVTGDDADASHDAALRAQYDGTHDLAAKGGDGAANQ